MTEEELLAEEYICNGKCQDDITRNYVHCKTCTRLKDFLAGYKVGKTELEKENAELKTKKIPQLERRIASIRGSHRVDVKKLNARIEQVERLKKENAELKTVIALKDEEMGCIETDFNTFKSQAKELLERLLITSCNSDVLNLLPNCSEVLRVRVEAEQFISEVEK